MRNKTLLILFALAVILTVLPYVAGVVVRAAIGSSIPALAYSILLAAVCIGGILWFFVWIATMVKQAKQNQSGWVTATLMFGLFGLLVGSFFPLLIYLLANLQPQQPAAVLVPSMPCPGCGAGLIAGAAFCRACGKRV